MEVKDALNLTHGGFCWRIQKDCIKRSDHKAKGRRREKIPGRHSSLLKSFAST
jgi:hypothetical protein